MRIDIITLFPEMCEAVLSESIIGRARKKGAVEILCHQLRDYAFDKHKRVDDTTYGGGMGMLMLAEPIALCYESICEQTDAKPHLIYLSPKGKTLTQKKLNELSEYDNICLLCGHYEGVDQRVLDRYVDEDLHRRLCVDRRRAAGAGADGFTRAAAAGCTQRRRML